MTLAIWRRTAVIPHWALVLTAILILSHDTLTGLQSSVAQTRSADELLAAAIKKATAEEKNIFVDFGASWCPPCVELTKFLEAPTIKPIIDKHLVVVPLTVLERGSKAHLNNPGAEELLRTFGGGGLPYFLVLNSTGEPIQGSRRGFRGGDGRVDGFVALLGDVSPGMTALERSTLTDYFSVDPRPASLARRIVWSTSARFGEITAVTPDGRLAIYLDGQDFFAHDLETGAQRRLATGAEAGDRIQGPYVSRDGRRLAYLVAEKRSGLREFRSLDLAEMDPQPETLAKVPHTLVDADVRPDNWNPGDWSSEHEWMAVSILAAPNVRIALLSTKDASVRVLGSVPTDARDPQGWLAPRLRFSPDAKWLAVGFDGSDARGDIRILSTETDREVRAVIDPADDKIFGWSADGRRLWFVSDRTGTRGLWSLSFDDGTVGTPALVAPNIGDAGAVGITPAGAAFYSVARYDHPVTRLAPLDDETGRPAAQDSMIDFLGETTAPVFSPDGRSIAYLSDRRGLGGRKVLIVADLATGHTREFRPRVQGFDRGSVLSQDLTWAPDGRSLALTCTDFAQVTFHRIDLSTGDAVALAVSNDRTWMEASLRAWSRENRIYFDRVRDGTPGIDHAVIDHDIASGTEREILSGFRGFHTDFALAADGRVVYFLRPANTEKNPPKDLGARDTTSGVERVVIAGQFLSELRISPDGKKLAAHRREAPNSRASTLVVIPVSGGQVRTLEPVSLSFGAWTPDSESVIARTGRDNDWTYWLVPVSGAAARRLNLSGDIGAMRVSPDGKRVAYLQWTFGYRGWDLWRIELEAPSPEISATSPPETQAPQPPARAKAPDPVKWTIAMAPSGGAQVGQTFNVILKATIEPGWHLYALAQPAGGPMPLAIDIPKGPMFSRAGAILEPTPRKSVDAAFGGLTTLSFEESAVFTVPVRVAPDAKTGRHTLQVNVEQQLCDDRVCLPPKTIELTLDVAVRPRAIASIAFEVALVPYLSLSRPLNCRPLATARNALSLNDCRMPTLKPCCMRVSMSASDTG